MKKINLLLLLIVSALSLTFITSCTPDAENADPTISFIAEGASVTADKTGLELGAPILFKMSLDQSIDTKKNIKTLSVKSISNNNINVDTLINVNKDNTLISLNFHAPSTYSTDEKFTFTIVDNANVSVTKTITVTTKAEPVNATPFGNIKTTGTFAHADGPCHAAYNLADSVTVSSTGADADKDMKNTDVTPAAFTGSWTSANGTLFVMDNSFDFDAGSVEEATISYDAGTPSATVTNPAVGNVYLAQSSGGAKYVIKITSNDALGACQGGVINNKGVLEFSYRGE